MATRLQPQLDYYLSGLFLTTEKHGYFSVWIQFIQYCSQNQQSLIELPLDEIFNAKFVRNVDFQSERCQDLNCTCINLVEIVLPGVIGSLPKKTVLTSCAQVTQRIGTWSVRKELRIYVPRCFKQIFLQYPQDSDNVFVKNFRPTLMVQRHANHVFALIFDVCQNV